MKVLIETYGCQMNTADCELIMGILTQSGFEPARTLDEADVVILNFIGFPPNWRELL